MEHHAVPQPLAQRGFTLLEVLIGLAIFSLIIGSVYSGYTNVIDIVTKTQYSTAAVSVIESRVEMVRNMRYQDVGTVGGIPSGILPQTEDIALGNQTFTLTTTVRNVDDAFDGTVDGNPRDLNPADYKLVQFDMSCAACGQYGTLSMVTYVSPKTLEDESRNGSLEVSVIDASGKPVPQATLRIVNAAANVDLTTTTNNDGKLLLLSVATGSAAYEITASKTGYSTDKTYPLGNPVNPLKPNVTVAAQQLTLQTMVIDRVGSLTVRGRDMFCAAAGPLTVQLTGSKLISTFPDIPKYSSAQTVSAAGALTLGQLEWDEYTITPTDTTSVVAGTTASLSFTLNPAASKQISINIASRSKATLLVSVSDTSGNPVDGAVVTVSGTGYDRSGRSGYWSLTDSDWSGGQYTDITPLLNVASAGQLTLLFQDGAYASGSAQTLTSRTFDLGTADASLYDLTWSPQAQATGTSVRFQIAANTDNATWEYVGPDGTSGSYFETSGQLTPSVLNQKRYVRYRAYLESTDSASTPIVRDVGISFTSSCLVDGQLLFDGMTAAASYTVTVSATGYQQATHGVTAPNAWQLLTIPLTP